MEWRLKLEELNFTPLETKKLRWEGNKDQKFSFKRTRCRRLYNV